MGVHWIDSITLKVIKDVGNCAKNHKLVTIGGTIGITKNVRGSNKNQEATTTENKPTRENLLQSPSQLQLK